MLGFAFAAQFCDDSGYSDDTVRVRVADVELTEYSGDTETPLYFLLPPLAIFAGYLLAMIVILFLRNVPRRETFIVFQVIDHAPPRAPPNFFSLMAN